MENKIITRDQLAKIIGKTLGLPTVRAKRLELALEEIILRELKTRQRVRVAGFGTFLRKSRKSHSIFEIRTKRRRLLLERETIKFLAAKELKRILNPYLKEAAEKPAISEAIAPAPGAAKPPEKIVKVPADRPKPQPKPWRIKLAPLKMMPRVKKETAERKIKERLINLARKQKNQPPVAHANNLPTRTVLDQNPEGRLFSAIFKQIASASQDYLTFSLSEAPEITIFAGRPRQKLADIPTKYARDFLKNYFEIDDFAFPQERFARILASSKIKKGGLMYVHVLPAISGASIFIKIKP